MTKPTQEERAARVPLPSDIQPGQTQFLRYNNGLVRGRWNGTGSVAITWHSGFATSCPPADWNDRQFVHHPERARLLDASQEPAAHAWFENQAQDRRLSGSVAAQPSRKRSTP